MFNFPLTSLGTLVFNPVSESLWIPGACLCKMLCCFFLRDYTFSLTVFLRGRQLKALDNSTFFHTSTFNVKKNILLQSSLILPDKLVLAWFGSFQKLRLHLHMPDTVNNLLCKDKCWMLGCLLSFLNSKHAKFTWKESLSLAQKRREKTWKHSLIDLMITEVVQIGIVNWKTGLKTHFLWQTDRHSGSVELFKS